MTESTFIRVAHTSEVRKGRMLEVAVGSGKVLLCHTREGWFALDHVCTHAYARLCEGHLRRMRVICPLHGAAFDCRTGAALGPPAVVPLKTYVVRVIGEDVQIAVDEQPAR
jgi:3-phenylpropionate/trans-cinnamate dioxygenase ferredoxin component